MACRTERKILCVAAPETKRPESGHSFSLITGVSLASVTNNCSDTLRGNNSDDHRYERNDLYREFSSRLFCTNEACAVVTKLDGKLQEAGVVSLECDSLPVLELTLLDMAASNVVQSLSYAISFTIGEVTVVRYFEYGSTDGFLRTHYRLAESQGMMFCIYTPEDVASRRAHVIQRRKSLGESRRKGGTTKSRDRSTLRFCILTDKARKHLEIVKEKCTNIDSAGELVFNGVLLYYMKKEYGQEKRSISAPGRFLHSTPALDPAVQTALDEELEKWRVVVDSGNVKVSETAVSPLQEQFDILCRLSNYHWRPYPNTRIPGRLSALPKPGYLLYFSVPLLKTFDDGVDGRYLLPTSYRNRFIVFTMRDPNIDDVNDGCSGKRMTSCREQLIRHIFYEQYPTAEEASTSGDHTSQDHTYAAQHEQHKGNEPNATCGIELAKSLSVVAAPFAHEGNTDQTDSNETLENKYVDKATGLWYFGGLSSHLPANEDSERLAEHVLERENMLSKLQLSEYSSHEILQIRSMPLFASRYGAYYEIIQQWT